MSIHDDVATKQDLKLLKSELEAKIDVVRHQLFTRLGSLTVVLLGLLFAGLHYWPPHG